MRSFWSRRRFVGSAAKVSTLLVATGGAFGCSRDSATSAPPEQETAAPVQATLQRIAYLLFPFPEVGAEPYERVASTVTAAAEADTRVAELVSKGLALLNSHATGPWLNLEEAQQLDSLKSMQGEPFFAYMLNTTKGQLFNDRTIWAHIGFDSNAPLNDIDWLGDN